MRVLFYNWADYLDPERRGGGVSVYQRNLLAALNEQPDIDTAFLSSGLLYDLRPGAPYVRLLEGGSSPRYAIVNSGLIAPSHADFGGEAQLSHPPTEQVFAQFVDDTGPWDVIHFNNLEGLPANILDLKSRWPQTRFVLSLHNYYPFCPQVNLWHQERQTCPGYEGGTRCETCLPVRANPRSVKTVYAVGTALTRIGAAPGTTLFDKGFKPALGLAWRSFRRTVGLLRSLRRRDPAQAQMPQSGATAQNGARFERRRHRMVELINERCDAVLCVSGRVRDIAQGFGIREELLQTAYIGTREAEAWSRTAPRESFLSQDGTLRLAYLGYMRKDKGFHFLMEALSKLPTAKASRIHLIAAAKSGDTEVMSLMQACARHIGKLDHVDGYSHDNLDTLLSDVGLGVVPVLWEDNLPQVAIEMHARHIPLLTSDRGGAQELGRCPDLVFKAGDATSFETVLSRILDGDIVPQDYWKNAVPPTRMHDHVDRLLGYYRAA